MAFHLGCLRALHRLGLLERARVLATVSGGSVIGGMYAVHDGPFKAFEERVRHVLERGFVRPAIRTALTTAEGPRAVASFALLAAAWVLLLPARLLGRCAALLTPREAGRAPVAVTRWLPARFASRTTILRRTFDRLLFQGRTLGSLGDRRPRLIAIAAELRTGSAFYFGNGGAGSWRLGRLDASSVPMAHAVAASAAYPLLLPALDEWARLERRDGSLVLERVTLTDGGVYDNLGLAPLWPDRDPEVSIGVEEVDTIIACRAGYGPRTGEPNLWLLSRMQAVFSAIHSRAQNATMKRLFDLKASGRIKGFALPYLDQVDERLAEPPTDLVRRAAVADYPTNFSAMPPEWIDKLSRRGEQLTVAVIAEHMPHLLSAYRASDGGSVGCGGSL